MKVTYHLFVQKALLESRHENQKYSIVESQVL